MMIVLSYYCQCDSSTHGTGLDVCALQSTSNANVEANSLVFGNILTLMLLGI